MQTYRVIASVLVKLPPLFMTNFLHWLKIQKKVTLNIPFFQNVLVVSDFFLIAAVDEATIQELLQDHHKFPPQSEVLTCEGYQPKINIIHIICFIDQCLIYRCSSHPGET